MFKRNENRNTGYSVPLRAGLDQLAFNDEGLVPVIAQQHDTGTVLMLAWMNRAALDETLATGRACYYSRSRAELWRKGESSGQTQRVRELRIDCDGDTVLLQVDQSGPACHTGRRDCFYWKVEDNRLVLDGAPMVNPDELYAQ